jgi:hypothetical protein
VQFRRRQQAVPVVAAGGAVCDPAHVACQACRFDAALRWVRSGVPHALPRARTVWGACWRLVLPRVRRCRFRRHSCPASCPPPTAGQVHRMTVWRAGCVPRQDGAATMLLCDACDGGFHMRCRIPSWDAWAASACRRLLVLGLHSLTYILPLLATRAAARGPMALALRPCTIPIITIIKGSTVSVEGGGQGGGLQLWKGRRRDCRPTSALFQAQPGRAADSSGAAQTAGLPGSSPACTTWASVLPAFLDRRSAMPKHQAPRQLLHAV